VIERFGPMAPLPETDLRVSEILTLPLHPHLPEACVDDVALRLLPLLG
jgi:dTDP-4-amino-4,6-dideoxygalactose transaminase